MDLYLATDGYDRWSGRLPQPQADRRDGPLATFAGAVQRVRALKDAGELDGPLTVWVRGGVYPLSETLRFTPEDSWPVTYAAYRKERPVFDGGQRITEWAEESINGRAAWVAVLPEVAEGRWNFRQLFVNGRRAPRPRLPKKGLYRMAAVPGLTLPASWRNRGQTDFLCAEGDVRAFRHLGDVDVVALHFWTEERSPIAAFDPATRRVTMARPSRGGLVGFGGSQLADYYLDNVGEALTEPGEWYLDRAAGRLYYLPRRGERPDKTEVWAPRLLQLVTFMGNPEENRHVDHITFRGLTFRHTDWRHPGEETGGIDPDTGVRFSRGNDAATSQAASDAPGVIRFVGARHCKIEACTLERVGWYGIEIGDGCCGVRVVGNVLRDLGAGGVKLNGASAGDDCAARETHHHVVTDNDIHAGGRVFHSAVGVLSMHAHDIVIAHNHIHDLFYTGISCGWEWGYQASASYGNRIEFNHVHDIGQGLLSDLAGIYTLGVQPGTVIRGNLVHGMHCAHYGGSCIYPDEGSSHILIEGNMCYDADRHVFHQHYGRENMVRQNIFAFGGQAVATYSKLEPHSGLTFERNILVSDGKPMWFSQHPAETDAPRYISDLNLLWDVRGGRPVFQFRGGAKLSLAAWRRLGHDVHSLVKDPGFRNLAKRDFTFAPNAAARALGIAPIDSSTVGPRKDGGRRPQIKVRSFYT
jgi:hypothetical protein